LPPMRTSARSQARTSMRPLTLEISMLPRASSGRLSLIGVAAIAGSASEASRANRSRVDVMASLLGEPVSGERDALGQGQALRVDALPPFEQEQGIGRLCECAADQGGAGVEFGEQGRGLRDAAGGFNLAHGG